MWIEPCWIVGCSVNITDRDNGCAPLIEQAGCVRPDASEPLDGDGRLRERIVVVVAGFASNKCDAPSWRFFSAITTSDDRRFTSHNTRERLCLLHAVSIHDPRHRLRIGPHVGCRNVFVWPDGVSNFVCESSSKAFLF